MKNVPIYIVLFLAFAFTLNSQPWIDQLPQGKLQNGELTFYEIQEAFNDYWEPFDVKNGYYELNGEQVKAPYWKQFKRWEWYWENRINPETGEFPKTSAWDELQEYLKENPGAKSSSGTWTSMGPNTTSGGYAGLGRLNCVAFDPNDNNTIYVGSASGGIWKTTNGGSSWTPLGDGFPVLGVSDILIHSGSNIIYVATGDRDGGSMWSLGGGQYNDNNSVGVLKSTDGGITWSTTGLSFTASQQRTVNRMLLDPVNENILYAATSVGLYKSTNAGVSWTLLTSIHFVDIKFNTGSSATIYGSTYGGDIYRSTNNGSNWSSVLSTSNGRTELAVSANNSNIVYAVMESGGGLAGVYKSTNSGASFTQVFSGATTNMLNWDCNSTTAGGQGSYDLCIAADPTNVNNVFVGGVNTWRSSNGGTSWTITNHWTSSWGCGVSEVHADQHFLAYQNGTSTLYECNDGGLYRTANNGTSWTHHGNGLVTSQIYRLGTAQTSSNDVIIGLQDNGTKAMLTGSWSDELGGDGFECAYDWSNHNIMYGELYYGDIRRSTNHGGSWSSISSGITGSAHWCTPFVLDATTSSTLYIGYQDVWKSTNQGTSWSQISSWGGSTIRSLAVTPANASVICAATQTTLYRTINGGASWLNITGTLPTGSANITYVWIKDTDQNTIWVSLGGYNSYGVYQTTDGGTSWTNISTGLPSIPVMCVIQNKQNTTQNELYAGTDVGVYVKIGSSSWSLFSSGLPNVVVTELEIYYAAASVNSRLRAATYGRGLWESDLYSGSVAPVADFSASTTSPAINTDVMFTDLSTNVPTSWSWSFSGSGNVTFVGGTNANSQNPQVQFDAAGAYTVELIATNLYGSDTEIKTNYINVINCTYCTSSYSNTTDEWISNVSLNTINNPSGSTTYSDFTSISTDVIPGSSYGIAVEISQTSTFLEQCIVFIDWDQDCDFTDIGESYDLGDIGGSGTLSSTVNVPAGALPGSTRMRVSLRYNVDPDGCDVTDYGEAEDYTINVAGGGHVTLDLKAYLEGPFNGTNMNADIIPYLPLSQPFNMPIWNYSGTESVGSIPNANVVAWVLIDVRDATSAASATSATSVAKQAAFILRDGSIVDLDGSSNLEFDISISQNMYVAIWQRNHLGIISNNAIPSSGGVYTYDYTTGINQSRGGTAGHKQLSPGVWGMYGGDGDHNGQINTNDKANAWDLEAGEKGYLFGDYNLDGDANNQDKDDIWVPNQSRVNQVPN